MAGTVSEIARVPRSLPATPSSRNWMLRAPGWSARRNEIATGLPAFVTSVDERSMSTGTRKLSTA